jgi:hypothetical protein
MPRSPNPSIVVFDIGGVLIDWNPRYLYRKLFAEDTTAMEESLTSVCTPDWNLQQDAGRPWKEEVDDLSSRYPEMAACARAIGMQAVRFTDAETLRKRLGRLPVAVAPTAAAGQAIWPPWTRFHLPCTQNRSNYVQFACIFGHNVM